MGDTLIFITLRDWTTWKRRIIVEILWLGTGVLGFCALSYFIVFSSRGGMETYYNLTMLVMAVHLLVAGLIP